MNQHRKDGQLNIKLLEVIFFCTYRLLMPLGPCWSLHLQIQISFPVHVHVGEFKRRSLCSFPDLCVALAGFMPAGSASDGSRDCGQEVFCLAVWIVSCHAVKAVDNEQ